MFKINLRKLALMCIDAITIIIASIIAFIMLITMDAFGPGAQITDFQASIIIFAGVSVVCMYFTKVYVNIWRFAQISDFVRCFAGLTVAFAFTYVFCDMFEDMIPILRTSHLMLIFSYLIAIFGIVVLRTGYSWIYTLHRKHVQAKPGKIPTLIVGAGNAAHRIITEMRETACEYEPICIVDDDNAKQSLYVRGIKVKGKINDIPDLCKKYGIKSILIAIPSLSVKEKKSILDLCAKTSCEIKTLPYIHEMILSEGGLIAQAKKVKIEDLLGRDVITFDNKNVAALINGRVCMVTGGGGSIGSELCRQIAKYKPRKLIIFDIYENNAYEIQQELIREYGKNLDLYVEIGSVRDYAKLDLVFSTYNPQLVFHAAAHKHVPLMETNPEEAVKNNVFGTYNAATLAELYKVEKFVLISTDKAVNPTNVMGATKRCCEMIVQEMAQHSNVTKFITVRFGNVLGSNGSVIPLFERQLEEGGPLTVTHPDIIRYFMTIPEAVSLILQAASDAMGGEIFVLDMGEPVKIVTLAENLIRLHGKEPYKDVEIKFTGLRPGEKLFEELLMDEEGLKSTENKKIFIGKQIFVDEANFMDALNKIKRMAMNNDKESVIEILAQIVPTFNHKTNE